MASEILPGSEPFSHVGGSDAVLVLHGFTGSPATLRTLAEALAVDGYTVELPLLPGHGTSVADLKTTSWEDWAKAALSAYDELVEHSERVAVLGLSMGGGLAAFVAEERPSVAACVFINPFIKPLAGDLLEGLRQLIDAGMEEVDSIGSDIKAENVREASYDATPLVPLLSLSEGAGVVYENLARITAPSLLLSSREDHVVPTEHGDDLAERVGGPLERVWLENSYHVATLDNDRALIESLTLAFLARVLA